MIYWDFLLLQLRDLGADGFDLGGGVLDVQTVLQSVLLAVLHQLQDVPIDLQIVVGYTNLGLYAAKLQIVPGKLRKTGDQRIAALIRRLVDLGVGRFDAPADSAPEVELP